MTNDNIINKDEDNELSEPFTSSPSVIKKGKERKKNEGLNTKKIKMAIIIILGILIIAGLKIKDWVNSDSGEEEIEKTETLEKNEQDDSQPKKPKKIDNLKTKLLKEKESEKIAESSTVTKPAEEQITTNKAELPSNSDYWRRELGKSDKKENSSEDDEALSSKEKRKKAWREGADKFALNYIENYFTEKASARRSKIFASPELISYAEKTEKNETVKTERTSQLSGQKSSLLALQRAIQANMKKNPTLQTESSSNQRKMDFYENQGKKGPLKKGSSNLLMAGTILEMVLITGINSDLPGLIKASIIRPVFDSKTGSRILIPAGTFVIGDYNSGVDYAQQRVQVGWKRLIFPNGSSIDLGNLPGVDHQGFSGLGANVDEHWDRIVSSILLSSGVSAASGALAGPQDSTKSTPAQGAILGAGKNVLEIGNQIAEKQLNIPPTLTLEPGSVVSAFINSDLELPEYF